MPYLFVSVHFQICINGAHLIIPLHHFFIFLKSSSLFTPLTEIPLSSKLMLTHYFIFWWYLSFFSLWSLWRSKFLLELLSLCFHDPVLFGLELIFWIIFFLLISGLYFPCCPQTLEVEFFSFCYLHCMLLFLFFFNKSNY